MKQWWLHPVNTVSSSLQILSFLGFLFPKFSSPASSFAQSPPIINLIFLLPLTETHFSDQRPFQDLSILLQKSFFRDKRVRKKYLPAPNGSLYLHYKINIFEQCSACWYFFIEKLCSLFLSWRRPTDARQPFQCWDVVQLKKNR